MIDSWVNVNMTILAALAGELAGFFLVLSPNILLVIGQGHIEIKGLIPLVKPQSNKSMFPSTVLDFQDKVPRRVKGRLDGVLSLTGVNETSSEKLSGVGILKSDLASGVTRNNPETTRPDLVGLQPFSALVAAAGGPRWDFVNGDLSYHQEGVLEGFFVVLKRHRWVSVLAGKQRRRESKSR